MPNLSQSKFTAGGESSPIVLHDHPRDRILEGFVEFAESTNHEIYQIVDISVCFFLVIDGLVVFIGLLLTYAEKVVYWVIHYLQNLLWDELFLSSNSSTSP